MKDSFLRTHIVMYLLLT